MNGTRKIKGIIILLHSFPINVQYGQPINSKTLYLRKI